MSEMFSNIDAFVIRWFTRVAHAVQRRTGITNFWLARIALMVNCAAVAVMFISFFIPVLPRRANVVEVLMLVYVAIGNTRLLRKLERMDERARKDTSARSVIDLGSWGTMSWRLFWLFVSALDVGAILAVVIVAIKGQHANTWPFELVRNMWSPALFVVSYLIAVTPLPPGAVRERRSLFSFFRLATSEGIVRFSC